MKQIKLFQTAIHALHRLITREEFMNRSRKKETDFTRNRKLDFPSVVSLIMSIMTKPIHAELCSSFPKRKADIAQTTQQSFREARQKIHYQAFEEIFQQDVHFGLSASDGKTFRGYRLPAIDGNTIPLKKSDELREYFAQTTHLCPTKSMDVYPVFMTSSITCFWTHSLRHFMMEKDSLHPFPLKKLTIISMANVSAACWIGDIGRWNGIPKYSLWVTPSLPGFAPI